MMFETSLNLCINVRGGKMLHEAVVNEWPLTQWKISYVPVDSMRYGHMLAEKDGFGIGAVVYTTMDPFVHVVLEDPNHRCLTSWQIPYHGTITPGDIIRAMTDAIEIFETEEI
jgi:hypothetical protein